MTSIFNHSDQNHNGDEDDAYRSHLVPEELPYDFQQASEAHAAALPPPLSEETKLGFSLLTAALIAGVTGNLLLHNFIWGINVSVWIIIVLGLLALLLRRQRASILGEAKWLMLPILFFAATFAWRDSATLHALSLLSLLLLGSMMALRARIGKLVLSGVSDHFQSIVFGSVFVLFGPAFLILNEMKWRELPRDGWSKKTMAIGRGGQ